MVRPFQLARFPSVVSPVPHSPHRCVREERALLLRHRRLLLYFLFWTAAGAEDFSGSAVCIPHPEEVEWELSTCADHCMTKFSETGMELASVVMSNSECCCHSVSSCRCNLMDILNTYDVLMMPDFAVPEEICPDSRVKGGCVRHYREIGYVCRTDV